MATIYSGELRGIELALDFALEAAWEECEVLNIWSDDQAAIQAVDCPGNSSGQYILRDIVSKVDMLHYWGIKVALRWIPAHNNVDGNEAADVAAKEASNHRSGNWTRNPCYLTTGLKQLLDQSLKVSWAKAWNEAKQGRVTYRYHPEPTKDVLSLHFGLKKALSSILIQVKTGKIGLAKYLFDIGRADSEYCHKCTGEAPQTIRHVLLECPVLSRLRCQSGFLDHHHWDLRTILTDPCNARLATIFMLKTRLLGQFGAVSQDSVTDGSSPQ